MEEDDRSTSEEAEGASRVDPHKSSIICPAFMYPLFSAADADAIDRSKKKGKVD
jgi:hypothetical protein